MGYSFWSNYEAITEEIHMDKDCSYTTISVPFCDYNVGNYNFLFYWGVNLKSSLNVLMNNGDIINYAGYGIHHRQLCVREEKFYNIASYHSNRFLSNTKKLY